MTGQAIAMAASDGAGEDLRARLGVLFDTHHARLYRLARRLCNSAEDARDLVQDAFLRAARSPHSIPDGTPNEEAWLVRVLINLARDRWRKQAVEKRALPLVAHATVWSALGRLPPRRRAIVVMYELEGMEITAIAAMLNVAPVTVRWHLSRGRRELAKALRVSWRS
jgi:DNA-directed RNA polymerase specialized sigma24 family protein